MKNLFLITFLLLLITNIFSQNIVTDTLFIDFKPDDLIPFDLSIDSIVDKRTVNPKFVSFSQTKKFLLLPVDQEVSTKKPLSQELFQSLYTNTPKKESYYIEIKYLLVERYNGRLFNPYVLRADIPIYTNAEDSNSFIGFLSYNQEYKPSTRKTPKTEICEAMLTKWHREFKIDLLGVNYYLNTNENKPQRLISKEYSKPHYLNLNVGGVAGLNFWQFESEMYFTRPETEDKKWFTAHIIRYQNNKDLEMIAYGKKSEHFNKRFNNKWLLDVSSNLLIGLNKWKIKEDKTLYHLVNFSLSSNQSINFDKINQSGMLIKAGLFENLYYIIGMKPKVQIGLYVSLGCKF